jgi:hypothetical protein
MKRELIFKEIFYDTMKVGGKERISFFNDTDDKESVTSMTESQAIKWLFKIKPFRQLFINSFFEDFSSVRDYYGLQEPAFANPSRHLLLIVLPCVHEYLLPYYHYRSSLRRQVPL